MSDEAVCRTAQDKQGLLKLAMNESGVCRTAPATPSLLNISYKWFEIFILGIR